MCGTRTALPGEVVRAHGAGAADEPRTYSLRQHEPLSAYAFVSTQMVLSKRHWDGVPVEHLWPMMVTLGAGHRFLLRSLNPEAAYVLRLARVRMSLRPMRNIAVLLVLPSLLACGAPSPSDVAEEFFLAAFTGRVDDAMAHVATSSMGAFSEEDARALLVHAGRLGLEEDEEMPPIAIISERINGDVATVQLASEDEVDVVVPISLVREEGRWKVDVAETFVRRR